MQNPILRFDNTKREFYTILRKRVDQYFSSQHTKKTGTPSLYVKSVLMLCIYLMPMVLLSYFNIASFWFIIFLALICGLGMAGIGLCVMHDANHHSFSSSKLINRLVGYLSMILLGGFALNWRIQHNVIHHTYTNIPGYDEDIDPPSPLLRFEPESTLRWFHKAQWLYAWILYGLMTLSWYITKDYKQLIRYYKKGLLATEQKTFTVEFIKLIINKILYTCFILLPFIYNPQLTFGLWFLFFLITHFTAGAILALIFQSAHVVTPAVYPMPSDAGQIESSWAEHQLATTANFSPKSKWFSWLIGGLNYQIEHHLFPNISHVHYSKIAPIVIETAKEFNLSYHQFKSFGAALMSHQKMLWSLGRA